MLATIRVCFYISNTDLASYLGTSVHMLKSISCGRRDWSLNTLLNALELFDALEPDTPVAELTYAKAFLEDENQLIMTVLAKELKRLENKLVRKREDLTRLNELRQKYLRGLHACIHLLQVESDTGKRQWLELRKKHLLQNLSKQNQASVELIKAEIAGLDYQINELKKLSQSQNNP